MAESNVRELRPARSTSYFRVGSGSRVLYVFFDDESRADSERAWEEVRGIVRGLLQRQGEHPPDARVAVYRPTLYPGGWDAEAQLVGYRKQRVVEGDPSLGIVDREEELRRIEEAFVRRRRGAVARFATPS